MLTNTKETGKKFENLGNMVVCFNCLKPYDNKSIDCVHVEVTYQPPYPHLVGSLPIIDFYKKCPHCFATCEDTSIDEEHKRILLSTIRGRVKIMETF